MLRALVCLLLAVSVAQAAPMNRERAERLRAQAKQLAWPYPSSSGSPVHDDRYRALVEDRASFAEAAQLFVKEGDRGAATELAAGAWRLWMKAKDIKGGRAFLAAVLDGGAAPETAARAVALYGDGLFAFWAGDAAGALARSEAAVAVAEKAGDEAARALAYCGLARSLIGRDDGRAVAMAERARKHARAVSDAMDQAPLHLLASAHRRRGEYDRAAALFEESIAKNRRIHDAGMVAVDTHNLGWVELRRGRHAEAAKRFEECAPKEKPADPYLAVLTGMNRAASAYCGGRHAEARAAWKAVDEGIRRDGLELDGDEKADYLWFGKIIGSAR